MSQPVRNGRSGATSSSRPRLGAGLVLFVAMFNTQAVILVLTPILPQIAEDFGVSVAAAAQLRSVAGLTAGIIALALATIGGRFRLSRLLGWGLGLIALGSLGSALAPNFAAMVVTHVVIGVGLAGLLSGALAASEVWAESGQSARVLSLALIGPPVAWVIGQPIVGAVASIDWRLAWIAIPLLSSLAGLVALTWRDPAISDEGRDCDPHGLWKVGGVKSWAIAELLAFAAWGGALVYSGAVFIDGYGLDVAWTGLILGGGAVLYIPGNLLATKWVRFGNVRVMVVAALLTAVTVAVFAAAQVPVAVSVVAFGLAVFFAAGRTFSGAAQGLKIAHGRRLAAMSVRAAADQFGYLAGAGLGGLLLTAWGLPGVAYGFALLLVSSALVMLPQAWPPSGRA